jgi:hypothetical protein
MCAMSVSINKTVARHGHAAIRTCAAHALRRRSRPLPQLTAGTRVESDTGVHVRDVHDAADYLRRVLQALGIADRVDPLRAQILSRCPS